MCKEKAALRQEWKIRRRNIADRETFSRDITNNLLWCHTLGKAETVFVYLATGTEVETKELIEKLFDEGKRVAVPVCDTQTHTMEAAEIKHFNDLTIGAYGLLEPREKKIIPKEEIDLILVPGLAFDKDGYRLGYGGGYYDRYLEDFSGKSIGLCFNDCMTEHLPRGTYDKPVDMVMTEVGLYEKEEG